MEESERRHASVDGPMPGHEIGPHGDDPGARGGRNLYLWTGRHVRVSRSSGDSLSILSDPLEPHKHIRWDDTQLVSAGGAKGTDEQYGALRKGEGSGVGGIQFSRTTAVQDGRQARRPHRNLSQVLEPKSPDRKWTRDLENSRIEEKLRAGEKGARGDIGEGSPAGKHSRISNSKENDPGDEPRK